MNPWEILHAYRRHSDGLGFHVYAASDKAAEITCLIHARFSHYWGMFGYPERASA